jgi:serine/threonine protein kinase
VLATVDFIREVDKRRKTLDFCMVHGNVVLDEEEGMVYKCFFKTERRSPNLDLIRQFVDPNAEEFSLGTEGSYMRMKFVGQMLSDDYKCSMLSFLEVARDLQRLHDMDYCHGDIRVSNLILNPMNGEGKARLIDFDFAGKAGEKRYPSSLINLVDGERHPEVRMAIEANNVGEVVLKKEHDWYSMAAAMQCFEVTNQEDEAVWSAWIESVAQGEFEHKSVSEEDLKQKWVQLKESIQAHGRTVTR